MTINCNKHDHDAGGLKYDPNGFTNNNTAQK